MNILNLCNAISLFWEFSVCSHYFSIEVQRMLCTGRYWAWCRRKFPTLQSIHLHCFNGDPVTVKLWLDSYPGTYFGFSSMVKGFGDRQRRGLKTVPGNRLLLESDPPPPISPTWPDLSYTRPTCSGWQRRSLGWGTSLHWRSCGQVLPMGEPCTGGSREIGLRVRIGGKRKGGWWKTIE
jgi:hypothetical protein